MKHIAAGAHLPTPWLFEPAKRPTTAWTAVFSLVQAIGTPFLLKWSGARPMGEQW